MPFVQRFNEIIEKITTPPPKIKMWLNTFGFSVLIFIFGSLYLFARRGDYDLYIANKVFATTALVLVGLSFALSGLCYFWDFVDTKIIYRKHFGIVGLGYAIVHIIITLLFLSNKFPVSWLQDNGISIIFASLVLIILIFMAGISGRYGILVLGGKRWKKYLRYSGYTAFVFIIIHFALLKYHGWIKWISTRDPFLPPLSLLEIIFAVSVIILRIVLWIDVKKKQSSLKTDI